MNIRKKYVVYGFRTVIGNGYKALSDIIFDNGTSNLFNTEEEAIQALVEDKRNYSEYVILKQIYID